jgi:hypothetical protein
MNYMEPTEAFDIEINRYLLAFDMEDRATVSQRARQSCGL